MKHAEAKCFMLAYCTLQDFVSKTKLQKRYDIKKKDYTPLEIVDTALQQYTEIKICGARNGGPYPCMQASTLPLSSTYNQALFS